jgi:DNA-binding NarL/FixJ family response regulator
MLQDLDMSVVGEADNWPDVIDDISTLRPDAVVVDWDLLVKSGHSLEHLRSACSPDTVFVLVSNLNATQQATISSGADIFISRDDSPDRVANSLQAIALHRHYTPRD